jgi:hypothetical protein
MLVMKLGVKDRLELMDSNQRRLGQITIQQANRGLITGEFVPAPAFAAVQSLFRDYEEAVNLQTLAVVDQLDTQIAALGLEVLLPDGQRLRTDDVQIWSDGGISVRPLPPQDSIGPARTRGASAAGLPDVLAPRGAK